MVVNALPLGLLLRALLVASAIIPSACRGDEATTAVQVARMDPARPLYVATHPRVTTTLRFPGVIGAPEGRGFTEDAARQPGEYLVSWSAGDSHLTVTPLSGAGVLNLNVPYQGNTIVIYFYQVPQQLDAVASLILTQAPRAPDLRSSLKDSDLDSPAQLLGFIDRLKLVRAAASTAALASISGSLGLRVHEPAPAESESGLQPGSAVLVRVLRVARESGSGLLGFCLRLRNPSAGPLALDHASFRAATGSTRLAQAAVDCPGLLRAGEEADAFLVVRPAGLGVLSEVNGWRVSVNSVQP